MKTLILTAMALGLSFTASTSESDLNKNSLNTLLTTNDLSVSGDVHSYETFKSIYENAIKNNANIENTCEVVKTEMAECIHWLTYDLGDTAIAYKVYLPGNKLVSNRLDVSRGD